MSGSRFGACLIPQRVVTLLRSFVLYTALDPFPVASLATVHAGLGLAVVDGLPPLLQISCTQLLELLPYAHLVHGLRYLQGLHRSL